jgi:hypothetical protein
MVLFHSIFHYYQSDPTLVSRISDFISNQIKGGVPFMNSLCFGGDD